VGRVLEIQALAEKLRREKAAGKTIAMCHGCFDLMHPGHIKHFQAAKEMADVLVVTVTPDMYIDKGPDRPAFSQDLRADSIAALECVDYVAVNRWPTAEQTLRLLRPDIYVKGQEFENYDDGTGKLQRELRIVEEIGCRMRFTREAVFSSTKLLSTYFK